MRLILASASPRRADLLRAAGLSFETLAVDVDERVRDGETPRAYVQRLAAEKADAAFEQMPCTSTHNGDIGRSMRRREEDRPGVEQEEFIVLGADTAVVVDDLVLGKPGDEDEARRMIGRLAGRRHEVVTGLSLRRAAGAVAAIESTAVFFSPMSAAEIDWYVQSGEGRDKAGAYAIQGLASRFVHRIEGSYSNVVGLPIGLVYQLLRELNLVPAVLASER